MSRAEVKVFNVMVPVVALIVATDADHAIRTLRDALMRDGFEPYEGDGTDAFESEEE